MKPYYYHTSKKIDVKKALKSVNNFNRAKNNIEKEIKERKEKVIFMKNSDEIIHESFTSAIINYKEGEKSNFNFLFSAEMAKKILCEKRKMKREVKIELIEPIDVEQKLDLEKVNEFIKENLRKLKKPAKFYFCLRHSIKFDKPIDEYEEYINRFADKYHKYDEIKMLYNVLFDKTRTRQSIEQSVRYTTEKLEETIQKNKEIKEVLEKSFYRN